MAKGTHTLGLELDSFTPAIVARANYRAVAVGSSALDGLVREEFSCDGVESLRELVVLADMHLGVPSGLISVIQVRAAERAFEQAATAQPVLLYSLVQSLIVTPGRKLPRHYDIATDETGQPLISVEDNGQGSAQTTPRLNRKDPYVVQFAPFSEAYPPRHLAEARTAHGAPGLFVAATGLELESAFTGLPDLQKRIFALAETG